jgi:hypothetical protein
MTAPLIGAVEMPRGRRAGWRQGLVQLQAEPASSLRGNEHDYIDLVFYHRFGLKKQTNETGMHRIKAFSSCDACSPLTASAVD